MKGRRWQDGVLVLFLLFAPPAWADIDPADYQTPRALRSEAERRQLQAKLADERAAEERRQREQALAEQQRRAEAAARLAARPWPERLTETHCTRCHAATHYTATGHTRAVWWLVVLRMRVLNQAPLGWQDMAVITAYLAAVRPASEHDALIETAMVFGLPLLALLAAVVRYRGKRLTSLMRR
ncbi:MAG: hypothetical protein N2690_09525 [Rhodocyclaceae bacterium]|nr:hypothetical protein [Rhodocyclaceae bacterium]